MCCGNKKKPATQQVQGQVNPAQQPLQPAKPLNAVPQPAPPLPPGTVIGSNPPPLGPMAMSNFSPVGPSYPGVVNPAVVNPLMAQSRSTIDRMLQKSKVTCQQVNDPSVRNFFKDCRTQRIQLTKVTNEHNSYVRNYDYFDVSTGHYTQLNNLKSLQDPKLASYAITDGNMLATPSINKFVYDQDIVDINFVPKTTVYKNNYEQYAQPAALTNIGNFPNQYSTIQQSGVIQPVQPVQPINAVTYSTVQPVQIQQTGTYGGASQVYTNPPSNIVNRNVTNVRPNQYSTVQPFNSNTGSAIYAPSTSTYRPTI